MELVERKVCALCRGLVAAEQEYCGNCGYPANSTEKNKKSFKINRVQKKKKLDEIESKIKNAGYFVFLIAAFNAFYGLIVDDPIEKIIYFVLVGLYVTFGVLALKKPFIGILLAFVLYGTLLILTAFVDPSALFSGIFIKILIIGSFFFALTRFKVAKELKLELDFDRMDGKEV